MLNFIEYQLCLDEEVGVMQLILIVYHHEAHGVVGSGFGHDLACGNRVQPVFQVVGTDIGLIEFKVDDDGELIEGEQVFGFLIQVLLEVDNIIAVEVSSGAFAEEKVAAAIENDEVAEAIFFEIFEQEVSDRCFRRTQFSKLLCQFLLIEFELFFEGSFPAGFHIHHFFDAPQGMTQFVGFGSDGDDIDGCVVNPALQKNLVGIVFEYEEGDFAYGIEIWIASINVAIL